MTREGKIGLLPEELHAYPEPRVHRVGTLTLGISLLAFGILFLLNTAFGVVGYGMLLKSWPLVLISLGIEILVANVRQDMVKMVYDKAAIWITAGLLVFAVCMAFLSQMIAYGIAHVSM